jgi:hypothetical protein
MLSFNLTSNANLIYTPVVGPKVSTLLTRVPQTAFGDNLKPVPLIKISGGEGGNSLMLESAKLVREEAPNLKTDDLLMSFLQSP